MPEPEVSATTFMSEDSARRLLVEITGGEEPDNVPEAELPSVPGYILKRRIGRGGSSSVYLGFREGFQRPLAIKVLEVPLGASSDVGRRAMRELDLLIALRLPALPRVIDFGTHGGRLFIATEFVDGARLDEAVEALDRRGRVELLARICDAVQSLHEHGVIHRDLKPANVLIDSHGDPVIIDLGIARLLTSASETLTCAGAALGSPAYMAPEQARGDQTSVRTDVFGLGATACVLLTGHSPYDTSGRVEEILRRIAAAPPRAAQELDPTLPRTLAAVMDKAMAARPEERYGSAGEFGADLRRWLRGEAVSAQPPGRLLRIWRWVGRHPVAATAAACTVVGVFILSATISTVWWTNSRPGRLDPDSDRSFAYLRTLAGKEIKRWGTGERGCVSIATLVKRPTEFGGGRLALLSIKGAPEFGGTRDELSAFSLDDLRNPLWVVPGVLPEMAMPPNDIWEHEFKSVHMIVADVFPQTPGDEIVVAHGQARCPCVIRIYDVRGNILYEAWHLGLIGSMQWLPSAQVLIASADHHGREADRWIADGFVLGERNWPKVLFALKPELGVRHNQGWINALDDYPSSKAVVAWYRHVMPRDQLPVHLGVGPNHRRLYRDVEAVEVELHFGPTSEGLVIMRLLGADGHFVPGSEMIGDPYRRVLLPTRPTEAYTLEDAVDVCGVNAPRAVPPVAR